MSRDERGSFLYAYLHILSCSLSVCSLLLLLSLLMLWCGGGGGCYNCCHCCCSVVIVVVVVAKFLSLVLPCGSRRSSTLEIR